MEVKWAGHVAGMVEIKMHNFKQTTWRKEPTWET
jgi:hypothetical protein